MIVFRLEKMTQKDTSYRLADHRAAAGGERGAGLCDGDDAVAGDGGVDRVRARLLVVRAHRVGLVVERAQGEPSEPVHRRVAPLPGHPSVPPLAAPLQLALQQLPLAVKLAHRRVQHVKVEVELRR